MLTIKPMGKEHLERVLDIESSCFTDPWSMASFEYDLKNPNAYYTVACIGDKVVGFAGMHFVLDEGHITNIAVDKSCRGMGIGHALVLDFLDFARGLALSFMMLEVRQSNAPAIKLYQAHGFNQIHVRDDYYKNPTEDAVIMILNL